MGRWFAISALAASLAVPVAARAAGIPGHPSPKIANYFLHWTVSEGEARELSKWDIVVLDMEVALRTPDAIRRIRRDNPQAIILAYLTPSEIRQDALGLGDGSALRARLARRLRSDHFLYGSDGSRRSFWPGTWILNIASPAWRQELIGFVRSEVLASGLWDGVLFDNAWENISYFAHGSVDLEHDGRTDDSRTADLAWQNGLRALYREARAAFPSGTIIMENDGPLYAPSVQGVIIENFPRGGFASRVRDLDRVSEQSQPPRLAVLNSTTGNTGERSDYRGFRFGLGTALLADAYTSFDFGDQDHGQAWWYDEYNAPLTEPRAPRRRIDRGRTPGVWQRDFEGGVVVVNANPNPATIRLPAEVERLHGGQDPEVNSGEITSEVTIPSEDGVVLLRPIERIDGAAYRNGSFARFLGEDGLAVRSGVYSLDPDAPAGAMILRTDLGTDGRLETIRSQAGAVEVMDEHGALLFRFVPYGRFRGILSLAAGDTDGDRIPEIVTVPASGGGAHVKIWSNRGVLKREFFAFSARFQGGASIAVGDTDGDGRGEIIIGAGGGAAPSVRIFDAAGRARGPGFLAYAPSFRGGVNVAAGDLTGDGRAEIATGAGAGGGPQVRVWNADGTLRANFFAFDPNGTSGVGVGITHTGTVLPALVAFSVETLRIR